MTTNSGITVQVLEALLSPDASRRQAAEQVLSNQSLEQRVEAYMAILASLLTTSNTSTPINASLSQLVAVLLRRDVLKSTDARLLQHLVAPLLQAFQQSASTTTITTATTATAISNCLAAILSTLQGLDEEKAAIDATCQILQSTAGKAGDADLASLKLWVACAEYAPETFAQTLEVTYSSTSNANLLQQLVTHYVSVCKHQSTASLDGKVYATMTRLVVAAAAAATCFSIGNSKNKDDKDATAKTVIVSQLGTTTLGPLLSLPLSTIHDDTMALQEMVSHWLHAAQTVPALVCGDHSSVSMTLLQHCMTIITTSNTTASSSRLALLATDVCRNILTPQNQRQFGILLQEHQRAAMDQAVVERLLNILLQSVQGANGCGHDDDDDHDDDLNDHWLGQDSSSDDDDDEEANAAADYARDLLEAWIRNAPTTTVPLVLQAVEKLLASSENGVVWQNQWAAVVALEACLEGAPTMFRSILAQAIQTTLPLTTTTATSSSTRVAYQAIRFLGLACEASSSGENADVVRSQFGPQILQTLAMAVQSSSTSPKVCQVACLALISYCRGGGNGDNDNGDKARFVVPYLSDLLQALVAGPLSSTTLPPLVKVRAVGVVACCAQVAGAAFAPFYPHVMPALLILAQQQQQQHSSPSHSADDIAQLQGSAIEAATIIGQALSRESDDDDDDNEKALQIEQAQQAFLQDAHQIMAWILPVLNSSSSSNNSSAPIDLLLSACARIASVLQESYAPYAQTVLPLLLQRATKQTDVEITEGDEAGYDATRQRQYLNDYGQNDGNDEDGTESMTVAVPGRGLTKVSINTTQIQEKEQAIRAIYEHAESLGAAFGPYCKTFLDEFLLLVSFRYSPEVRATSAQTCAAILEAACLYGEQDNGDTTVAPTYFPLVAKAIAKEISSNENDDSAEMEVLYALADSLSEVMYSAYSRRQDNGGAMVRKFSAGQANAVVQACMQSIRSCLERRSIITHNLNQATSPAAGMLPLSEDEKEEYKAQMAAEQALLTPLVDSVGYTLKILGPAFVPIFEQHVAPILGPHLVNADRSSVDIRARLAAVCLWDDVVEHCGPAAAAKFAPQLVQGVLLLDSTNSNDEDEDLQQACIYGIAQMARYAPSTVLVPHMHPILQYLMSIFTSACESKAETDNLAILENSASTLASLVLIGPNPPFRNNNLVGSEAALDLVLKNLPLTLDYDEAKICHDGLCDLAEHGMAGRPSSASTPLASSLSSLSPWVLQRGPELVRILGETLAMVADGEEVATSTTCQRMAGILMRLQQQQQQEQSLQASFASLQPGAQAAVQQAMEQYSYQFNNNVVTP